MKGIIITGLTGSGKTQVAFELARKVGGEVINLDRTFTWKYFPISSGMSDIHEQKGVAKHLYEFLEPDQELITNAAYAEMVMSVAKDVIDRDKMPIVEGGSPKYFKDLYLKNESQKIFDKSICLVYPESTDVRERISKRIDRAIEAGLIEEIKGNLLKYRETQFMKEGKFVIPIVEYLDGKIDLKKAKENMVKGALDLIDYQNDEFLKYPNLITLENNDPDETMERIIKSLE